MKELLNNDGLLATTERLLGKKIGKDNVYKIQQTGTKYVGHAYFDVADNFLYECIVQTTGTVNTTANFKKCGVTENESKLQNLYVYKTLQVIVPYEIYSNKVFQIPEGTKFLSIYMARTATTEHGDFRFIDLNFLSIATPSQSIAWITRRYDINRYIYEDLTIKNGTIEMGTNNEVAHFIVAHI